MRTNTFMLACAYVYMYMPAYVYMYMPTQAHTHTHEHAHSMHTHMHIFALCREWREEGTFQCFFYLWIFVVRLTQSHVKDTPHHKDLVFAWRKNNLEVQAETCWKSDSRPGVAPLAPTPRLLHASANKSPGTWPRITAWDAGICAFWKPQETLKRGWVWEPGP